MTDTERLNALQSWLDSADLREGTISFRIPGVLEGRTRIGADIRAVIDAGMSAKGPSRSGPSDAALVAVTKVLERDYPALCENLTTGEVLAILDAAYAVDLPAERSR